MDSGTWWGEKIQEERKGGWGRSDRKEEEGDGKMQAYVRKEKEGS